MSVRTYYETPNIVVCWGCVSHWAKHQRRRLDFEVERHWICPRCRNTGRTPIPLSEVLDREA